MWGLFPLYWPLLEPAGAVEILAHRVVWSLAVVLGILVVSRRWAFVSMLLSQPRRIGLLAAGAAVITVNWGVYIYGVNSGHVVESSLGYFINPLVTVLLGVLVLGERLRPTQWAALCLGALAVVVLTVDYGRPPWIALVLAASFGTYGLMKKQADVGAVESLAVETTILFPLALAYLLWLAAAGRSTFGHVSDGHSVLLAAAGVVTAVPLMCFGAAAIRVPLTTIGLLQYLTPTMQLVFGLTIFHEAMPLPRLLGFSLVWLALMVFSADSLRAARTRRALAPAPATEPA